ncbi:MAG: rhomboid family intramembrane serine protease [Crenarchaeota archaeon]|nr:rhomboid family intramembrane serine protease [Thermoproteota archaeon]
MYEIKNPHNSIKYKPTYILLAVNIIIYICTSIIGGNFAQTDFYLTVRWGQYNALVFAGWYWQLVTSMFLHATIIHLGGNMLFLLIFGLRCEEMFSLPEYLGIYLLGGLAGNVLSLIMGPDFLSVGASGAIFALFGAAVIYDRRRLGQSIFGALIFSFFLLLFSSGVNVNYLAHIGGLAAGLLMGYILASIRKPETRYQVTYSYSNIPI